MRTGLTSLTNANDINFFITNTAIEAVKAAAERAAAGEDDEDHDNRKLKKVCVQICSCPILCHSLTIFFSYMR